MSLRNRLLTDDRLKRLRDWADGILLHREAEELRSLMRLSLYWSQDIGSLQIVANHRAGGVEMHWWDELPEPQVFVLRSVNDAEQVFLHSKDTVLR